MNLFFSPCMEYSFSDPSDLVVYLGRETQEGYNPNEISRGVTKIVNHPKYDTVTKNNDITLLRLSRTVTFTNYIRPVCLAGQGSSFVSGTRCWITGWGDINSGGNTHVCTYTQTPKLHTVT